MSARGGLDVRLTGPDTVHLIATAATPLGGDTIDVTVTVAPGARLRLRSVAATIALPGGASASSTSRWRYRIGAGGCLDVDAEPLIVAGGAHHTATTDVDLADGARLRLRERVQIGRVGEDGGGWRGDLRAAVDGRPLLVHAVELGPGTASDDLLDAPRALISDLRYPDADDAVTDGFGYARLPLAGGGTLATRLAGRLPR